MLTERNTSPEACQIHTVNVRIQVAILHKPQSIIEPGEKVIPCSTGLDCFASWTGRKRANISHNTLLIIWCYDFSCQIIITQCCDRKGLLITSWFQVFIPVSD